MSNHNRLLIDMDGVVTDTMGSVFTIAEREEGISLCHADVEDYWFKTMTVPPSYILDIMRRTGFYTDLECITGAVRAVNRLREDHNDNVFICTAPLQGAETCEEEKRDWIARHFDDDFADRTIVVKDKRLVEGRVLIEDNPHVDDPSDNVQSWLPIMFDQPWNRYRTDLPRMNNWGDLRAVERWMK